MSTDRDETIQRIRRALKKRSGKDWSVTGGRGTAWGWLRIDAPPAKRTAKHVPREGFTPNNAPPGNEGWIEVDTGEPGGITPAALRAELAALLGLEHVHQQGESIPGGGDYYREYIDRAEGRTPSVTGKPYWD